MGVIEAKNKKVIGILGGMGPMATADLFKKLTVHTVAYCDQAHPRVLIDSNTEIPDRTAHLLGGGADPRPHIIASAKGLERMGAELLLMPCNTAHCFYEDAADSVAIPILHMIRITRDSLLTRGIKRAALLATDGTVQTGIYQKTFEKSGIELICPALDEQRACMDIIYRGVKAGQLDYDASEFSAVCEKLLQRGAETLILGCTELPLAVSLYGLRYEVTDPTLELALAALRYAGCSVK